MTIPRLDDLLNDWKESTIFKEWVYTKGVGNGPRLPLGYLWPPNSIKRGLIQIWDDHVFVIISDDTISLFRASEIYRKHLKELTAPASNQYFRLLAADPNFFEDLGNVMEIIHGRQNT